MPEAHFPRTSLLGNPVNRANPPPTSNRKLLMFVCRHEIVITIGYVKLFTLFTRSIDTTVIYWHCVYCCVMWGVRRHSVLKRILLLVSVSVAVARTAIAPAGGQVLCG